MRRLRAQGDAGVAAVEFALISTVMLLIGFGAIPLFQLMRGYQVSNSASADALRYATSVDANAHTDPDTGLVSRRPTTASVVAFVRNSAGDQSLVVKVEVCPDGVLTSCAEKEPSKADSGDSIRVTVSKGVDLTFFGSLANAVGNLVGSGDVAPKGIVTISSTSIGREE